MAIGHLFDGCRAAVQQPSNCHPLIVGWQPNCEIVDRWLSNNEVHQSYAMGAAPSPFKLIKSIVSEVPNAVHVVEAPLMNLQMVFGKS